MMELPKVSTFLSSLSRNSASSKKAYSSGLFHLSNFISERYPKYNCENILHGHSKSPYWTLKEEHRREIYSSKCMKYLTFLDYTTLEVTGKNIESQLLEKDKEIQLLRQHNSYNADAIVTLSDQVRKLTERMELLRKSN